MTRSAASCRRLVVSPADEAEVASVLSAATARGLAVVARGGGTKLGGARRLSAARSCSRHRRITGIVDHEPADLVCVVRAGTPLALLPGDPRRSPGIQPASHARSTPGRRCDHRRRRRDRGERSAAHAFRYRARPRDRRQLRALRRHGGRSGGKVVKNVAGFDVAKLLVGSLGTLAVITEVAFRLHPVPDASRTVVLESRSTSELCGFAARVGRLQVTPCSRRHPLATRCGTGAVRQLGGRCRGPGRARGARRRRPDPCRG